MKVDMTLDALFTFVLAEKAKNENVEVLPCMYLSDERLVDRTWKERLFSLPWKPFKKTKVIEDPVAYVVGDLIIVSHKMYYKLTKKMPNGKP